MNRRIQTQVDEVVAIARAGQHCVFVVGSVPMAEEVLRRLAAAGGVQHRSRRVARFGANGRVVVSVLNDLPSLQGGMQRDQVYRDAEVMFPPLK